MDLYEAAGKIIEKDCVRITADELQKYLKSKSMDHTENELITLADFIGKRMYSKSQLKDGRDQQWKLPMCEGHFPSVKTMKFKTSWDWIMPVVEKIGGMWSPDFEELSIQAQHICDLPLNSHIQQVYKEVVEFIKWYNTTQPQAK